MITINSEEFGKIEINNDSVYFYSGDFEYVLIGNEFHDYMGRHFRVIRGKEETYLEILSWRRVK